MGTLDHIKQKNDERLGNFYTTFNKELAWIDLVIKSNTTIRTFVMALGPRSLTLYDRLTVIPVNTMEETKARVKS